MERVNIGGRWSSTMPESTPRTTFSICMSESPKPAREKRRQRVTPSATRRAQNRIVGLTMMNPRLILERDGHLTVTIPETIETTAEDLAPALVAC